VIPFARGPNPRLDEDEMAGGPHAKTVPCLVCLSDKAILTKAERTYEGDENDEYKCDKGHTFGMDWSRGEADEPQWPASDELKAYVESQAKTAKGAPARR
jgi:hypothetical protein